MKKPAAVTPSEARAMGKEAALAGRVKESNPFLAGPERKAWNDGHRKNFKGTRVDVTAKLEPAVEPTPLEQMVVLAAIPPVPAVEEPTENMSFAEVVNHYVPEAPAPLPAPVAPVVPIIEQLLREPVAVVKAKAKKEAPKVSKVSKGVITPGNPFGSETIAGQVTARLLSGAALDIKALFEGLTTTCPLGIIGDLRRKKLPLQRNDAGQYFFSKEAN